MPDSASAPATFDSTMVQLRPRPEPAGREAPAARPAVREHPSKLFVEVTTRCNLRCPMCVKRVPGSAICDSDLSEEIFGRLAPAFPNLSALILNGIGEPLLHPRLEPFILQAKEAMPAGSDIAFQTNGVLLSRDRAESLVRAGVDRICISLDALSPQLIRAIRPGADLGRVEQAFKNLADAKRRLGSATPSVGLEFVVMRDNHAELPDVVAWAAERGVGFIIVTQMMPYHPSAAGAAAHRTSTDRATALFEKWKARAAADGVDLGRYFDVFMRFHRNPEEQKIVDYANALFEEAHREGVFLRMENLLDQRGDALQRSVEEAFQKAEERAKASGISLTLPRLAPTHQRRCDFVEDGGAFVSWDGDVHPCYFLWHGYSSHVGGLAKRVKPLSFGNLADADVLEIWNGAAARTFREAVLKYDYPFCYDCTFALCDYQQGPEFTQDCYMSAVPCGACLWSTGVFQCLR